MIFLFKYFKKGVSCKIKKNAFFECGCIFFSILCLFRRISEIAALRGFSLSNRLYVKDYILCYFYQYY